MNQTQRKPSAAGYIPRHKENCFVSSLIENVRSIEKYWFYT